MPKKAITRTKPTIALPDSQQPRCGLCRKTKHLTRTDCCGNWICDDEHTYVLFSYARNSCHRNHSRYTLCAYHDNEGLCRKFCLRRAEGIVAPAHRVIRRLGCRTVRPQ
jgi:hypothetical protein